MAGSIRRCRTEEFETIRAIINDAAQAYRGRIPPDRWNDPYMSQEELQKQIDEGVVFWGHEDQGRLDGVMGLQSVQDVMLIRHAYVRTESQGRGAGQALLTHLYASTAAPVLIGTWAAAEWAVRFYMRQGFAVVPDDEKDRLLRRYWKVPERQIETSVVLADARWRARPHMVVRSVPVRSHQVGR